MVKSNSQPTYSKLFLHTLTLSAFTIGGGYVMVPLMKERFVDKLHWIDEDELAELTALGQSAPGAMVVNAAVLMGYRLLGFWGAICALLGTALPPIFILTLVCGFYELIRDNTYVSAAFRGMRAGVAAVIADTVTTMAAPYFHKDKAIYLAIMAAAFITAWCFKINVAFIILASGALGVLIGAIQKRRGRQA
ncbi:MAG: chromate transporter [Oscillospiraceae bacterium]